MKRSTRNLIATLGLLGLSNWSLAGDTEHKVIEIKAKQGEDITVVVESDGVSENMVFTFDEIVEPYMIESRVAHLDEETRETVVQALKGLEDLVEGAVHGVGEVGQHAAKVVVMHKGEGDLVHVNSDVDMDYDYEIVQGEGDKIVKKHIILGKHDTVLRGHSDAIVGLIERGEFSEEELEKIQAALDGKR